MKKFVGTLLLLAVVFLAACSSGDDSSDKEKVIDAFQNTLEATSHESTSNVDINLEGSFNDPMIDPYIQMFNDMEISFDGVYDEEAGKQEGTIHFQGQMAPMTINLDIPFMQDMDNEKVYVRTDSLVENFGMMLGNTSELSGKLLEIDLAQLEEMQGMEGQQDQIDPEELTEKSQEMIMELLDEKSEDDFTEEDGVYTVQLTKEDLINLMEKSGDMIGESIGEEEIDQMRSDLDQASEQVDVHQLEVQLTLNDDLIEKQAFVADVEFSEEDQSLRFGLNLDTTYSNMNGDVEFSIDPENEEIVTPDELNMMMSGGF